MKSDKKPVIGLICVILSCIFVIALTLGLLASAKENVVADSDADSVTDVPPSEPELEWGYKFKYFNGSIDGGWIGDIAYKSQKCTFNVDDVTLTVSFGSFSSKYGPEDCDVPEYDIYFVDPSGYIDVSIYTVKTVRKQFFSEEYGVTYVKDQTENWDYHYEFAHTEEITIPEELFTESEGFIRLMIGGTNIAEHSPYIKGYLILGEANIKYQLQGTDKVVLSRPYDDEWHY